MEEINKNKSMEEKEEFNKLEMREKEVFNSVGNRGFFKGNGNKVKVREYNKENKKSYYLENKDKLKANRKPLTDEQKEHNKTLRNNRNKGFYLYRTNPNTKIEKILKNSIKRLMIKMKRLKDD